MGLKGKKVKVRCEGMMGKFLLIFISFMLSFSLVHFGFPEAVWILHNRGMGAKATWLVIALARTWVVERGRLTALTALLSASGGSSGRKVDG